MAARFVTRDFRKGLVDEQPVLRGLRVTKVGKDQPRLPGQEDLPVNTEVDPLTGEVTEVKHSAYKRPRVPINTKQKTILYGRPKGARRAEVNYDHPLYVQIADRIASGYFTSAVSAANTIHKNARQATYGHAGKLSRGVNQRLAPGNTREDHIQAAYREMREAIYDTVMSVSDDVDDLRESGRIPEHAEIAINPVDGNWDAVLDLRNIQSLYSNVMGRYKIHNKGNRTAMGTATNYMKSSGIALISPHALAAYLGVNQDDMEAQRRGEKIVVPPTVLTKLNFFLQFAKDDVPDGELSHDLALFNDYDPRSDRQPDDPDYSAPMRRVADAHEKHEDLLEEQRRSLAAALGQAAAAAAADAGQRGGGRRDRNGTPDFPRRQQPDQSAQPRTPDLDRNGPQTTPDTPVDYANDPAFRHYFAPGFLDRMNEEIHDSIELAKREEKLRTGTTGEISPGRLQEIKHEQRQFILLGTLGQNAPAELLDKLNDALMARPTARSPGEENEGENAPTGASASRRPRRATRGVIDSNAPVRGTEPAAAVAPTPPAAPEATGPYAEHFREDRLLGLQEEIRTAVMEEADRRRKAATPENKFDRRAFLELAGEIEEAMTRQRLNPDAPQDVPADLVKAHIRQRRQVVDARNQPPQQS